jgi:hypothetical protein
MHTQINLRAGLLLVELVQNALEDHELALLPRVLERLVLGALKILFVLLHDLQLGSLHRGFVREYVCACARAVAVYYVFHLVKTPPILVVCIISVHA